MDKPFAYLLILYRTMLPHVLFLPHYGVVTTTRFESTAENVVSRLAIPQRMAHNIQPIDS